jgi:hypothetical protein
MRSRSMATRHRNNGSGPGEAFIANTSIRENCSADLVSVHREVDRAYHDPGILLHYAFRKKCISDPWSDTSQLSAYLPNYAQRSATKSMVMSRVSSLPKSMFRRRTFPIFLAQAVDLLRSNRTTVIYGTVRLIEKDDESFLASTKESYACIIFNLLTSTHRAASKRPPARFADSSISRSLAVEVIT